MGSVQETFLVQIKSTQNATWQGTVTWADNQETKSFRSALELINLIDSVVGSETEPAEDE